MRIFVLGALNIDDVYQVDHILQPGETLSSTDLKLFPGGKGLNQAVALAKAGVEVKLGGMIGSDGTFLLNFLKENSVDCSRVRVLDAPTGHAIIQVDRNGQNSILLFPGINRRIDKAYAEEFLQDAERDDLLLLQNEISALADIFAIAYEKGMQIAFNPSPCDESLKALPLSWVKWWFCNELEGAALFGEGEIAENFLRQYPGSNLILTLGEQGSLFCNESLRCSQPIYQTDVVDTTAAGDTYTGFFAAAVAKGFEIPKAMALASKAASITVSRSGAAASIPTWDEVYGSL